MDRVSPCDTWRLEIVPLTAFQFNSAPFVALDHKPPTFIGCCGNRVAIVSVEEATGNKTIANEQRESMQFLPPIRVQTNAVRTVTAIAFHTQRRLLAVCVAQLPHRCPAAIIVYSLATFNGQWVPTILSTLTWERGLLGEEFVLVDFSADATTIVAVTKFPSNVAVGFKWQSRNLVFTSSLDAPVEEIRFHPDDSMELSTSGHEHMQLWRSLHKTLKPRSLIRHLTRAHTCYTQHEWINAEVLAAGTASGDVAIIQQNEQTQRFSKVHTAPIRGFLFLKLGFATVCSACGLSIFQLEDAQQRFKFRVKLMRRLALVGVFNIVSVTNFPGRHVSVVLVICKHTLAILNLAQLLVSGLGLKVLPSCRVSACQHGENTLAFSVSTVKHPLLASGSIMGKGTVCIWNWKTQALFVVQGKDQTSLEQSLTCLDMHPSGHQLLVGFEDAVHLHHVGHQQLFPIQRISTRGAVHLENDVEPLVSTATLSIVKYANRGHFFAVVTGCLVQIFESNSRAYPGRARVVHALRGHAGNVKDLCWGIEDQRLFTVSEDGAIYEWSIGAFETRGKILSRSRDTVRLGVKWNSIAMFGDGALVAAGNHRKCQLVIEESLLCVWPRSIDSASVDVSTEGNVVTTILPVDMSSLNSVLVAGTTHGSVLSWSWPLLDDDIGNPPDIEKIQLCNGSVVALKFSCQDDLLCVAGSAGGICVCSMTVSFLGRDRSLLIHAVQNHPVDLILTERRDFEYMAMSLKSLEKELEETKAAARQQKKNSKPKFERLLREQQADHNSQLRALAKDSEKLEKELEHARTSHVLLLIETRQKFAENVKEMEFIYNKKLATEAARYLEIKDKADSVRRSAQNELEGQSVEHLKCKARWERKESALKEKFERRTQLLQEYLACAKHHAMDMLEDQDRHSCTEIFVAREEAALEISELHRMLKNCGHEGAMLKRTNEQLNLDYHKNRDELTEHHHAYNMAQNRASFAQKELSAALCDIQRESDRRIKLEDEFFDLKKENKNLRRWRSVLSDQKATLQSEIMSKDMKLAKLRCESQRLDKTLEDAGRQNLVIGDTLNRRQNELHQTRRRVAGHRKQVFTRDKLIRNLVEQIEICLLQLSGPGNRPHPNLLIELGRIKDLALSLKATSLPPDSSEHSRESLNVGKAAAYRSNIVQSEIATAHCTIRRLRLQNIELMAELNDLRFDRQSLRRKLGSKRTHP